MAFKMAANGHVTIFIILYGYLYLYGYGVGLVQHNTPGRERLSSTVGELV